MAELGRAYREGPDPELERKRALEVAGRSAEDDKPKSKRGAMDDDQLNAFFR
ncbi:MAG: hypothetical protein ING19_07635 [Azospirillum sp.]|nr:hypothetical protein [Azospirillum sp.]